MAPMPTTIGAPLGPIVGICDIFDKILLIFVFSLANGLFSKRYNLRLFCIRCVFVASPSTLRRDPEEPAFLVQLHAVSCNSASMCTALVADIKHRVLAMASGYGAKGQVGRCYPFWMDIQKCLATANSPNECALQKEVSPMDRAVGQGGSQMWGHSAGCWAYFSPHILYSKYICDFWWYLAFHTFKFMRLVSISSSLLRLGLQAQFIRVAAGLSIGYSLNYVLRIQHQTVFKSLLL